MGIILDSEASFLIPFDFSFLVRGGRVNGLVGGIGALLKLIPVMIKTDDGRRLEKYAIARTMNKAVADVIEGLKKKAVMALIISLFRMPLTMKWQIYLLKL